MKRFALVLLFLVAQGAFASVGSASAGETTFPPLSPLVPPPPPLLPRPLSQPR